MTTKTPDDAQQEALDTAKAADDAKAADAKAAKAEKASKKDDDALGAATAEAERWKNTALWMLSTQYPGHAIAHAHLRLADYNPPKDVKDALTEAVMELQVKFRS